MERQTFYHFFPLITGKKYIFASKIVEISRNEDCNTRGYTANPGDMSWKELEDLGELTVYDRTRPEDTVARAADDVQKYL